MANSKVDRNVNYMKENWGTVRLATDYVPEPKILQEIVYDAELNVSKYSKKELFEMNEDDETSFEYGLEPTYKVQSHQKVLRG